MSLWSWLGGIFHDVKVKVAPLVVGILSVIDAGETSGVLPAIAKILSPITATLSVTINNLVQANVQKQLAIWLGVENLSANPTPAQEQTFAAALVAAFASKKASATVKGEVEQALGVQIYNIIATTIGADKVADLKVTAAQIGEDVEESYQDLLTDLANANATATT
jgi:hypothetical protein